MLRSRNDVLIEANEGRGDINIRGKVKIDYAEIQNLTSPILQDLRNQMAELKRLSSSSQSSSSQSSQNNNNNNNNTLLNARLNTLEERINSIEEKIKTNIISMDERIRLLEQTNNVTTLTTVGNNNDESTLITNDESSTSINSVKEAAQKLIILRKAPITSKNVKYAW